MHQGRKPNINAHYTYNIEKEYNRNTFSKVVLSLLEKIKNIEVSEYIEDPLDGNQIQGITTTEGKIKVINDFMVGAVWVESEINLDDILQGVRI